MAEALADDQSLNSSGSDRVFERNGHVMVALSSPALWIRSEVVASRVLQLAETRTAIDAFANPGATGARCSQAGASDGSAFQVGAPRRSPPDHARRTPTPRSPMTTRPS